jgi:hypothetical protein
MEIELGIIDAAFGFNRVFFTDAGSTPGSAEREYRQFGVKSYRQFLISPIVIFANWRISTSNSPIGELPHEIRQLANILI